MSALFASRKSSRQAFIVHFPVSSYNQSSPLGLKSLALTVGQVQLDLPRGELDLTPGRMFDHTPTVGDIGRDIAVHHDGLATDRHIVEEVALDDVLQRQKHPCGVQGTIPSGWLS